jgi:hypothetical protein
VVNLRATGLREPPRCSSASVSHHNQPLPTIDFCLPAPRSVLMGWFSYELGRQDGIREERNRNSGGGCDICFWILVAVATPFGVAGLVRRAWKDIFHVEPPIVVDVIVVASVVVLLAVIAVDESRRAKGVQLARFVRLFGRFNLRRTLVIAGAGIVLVSALLIGIELAGLGVDSRPSVRAAGNFRSTTPVQAKRHCLSGGTRATKPTTRKHRCG